MLIIALYTKSDIAWMITTASPNEKHLGAILSKAGTPVRRGHELATPPTRLAKNPEK